MSRVVPEPERISAEEVCKLPVLRRLDDAEEIRLSGVAKTKAGELARHQFFAWLGKDIDDYSDVSFTPEEVERVKGQLSAYRTGGSAALPRLCNGERCPMKNHCIFFGMGRAPLARKCRVEVTLLKDWRMRYFEEYQVSIDSPTEISLVNELAEIDLLLFRLNFAMSHGDHVDFMFENPVGADREGLPIFQKQLSPLLEARDRLEGRKHKIIKLLVGDRQEKYKREAALKIREEKDPTQLQAEIRRELESMRKKLQALQAGNASIVEGKDSPPQPPPEVPQTPEDLFQEIEQEATFLQVKEG